MFGVDASLRDVGFVNKYVISADEYNFEITFTTNFTVLSHTFSAHDKMLQFNVDAVHEKENVAEIIIPRDLFDGEFTILLDGEEIFAQVNKTNRSSVVSIVFDGNGGTIDITATKYLGVELEKSNGGGCVIATATFGSDLASQVPHHLKLHNNTVLLT